MILFLVSLTGQDIHFSNNNLYTGFFNPAWQNTDEDLTFGTIYRNQGLTVTQNEFQTFGAQINSRIYRKGKSNQISSHALLLADRSGAGNLSSNMGLFGISYHRDWAGNQQHMTGIAGQIGIQTIQFNERDALKFEEELLGGAFSEDYEFPNIMKTRWNFGLLHNSLVSDQLAIEIGLAIGSLPKLYQENRENEFNYKYSGSFGFEIGVNDMISLSPTVFFQRIGKYNNLIVQTIMDYQMPANYDFIISGGFGIRQNDAFQVLLGGKMESWEVGLSYDINISRLSQASRFNSAVELGLIYKMNYQPKRQKLIRFIPNRENKNSILSFEKKAISEEGKINITLLIEISSNDTIDIQGSGKLLNLDIQKTENKPFDAFKKVKYPLEKNRRYLFYLSDADYYADSIYISTYGIQKDTTIFKKIEIKAIEYEAPIKVEIGKPVRLNNIYYDLDDFKILPESENQLEVIHRALISYPNMIIEISSHTDSQGEDDYNLNLSIKRAESVVNWLKEKGIPENRLQFIGYGETKLLNKCKNGVKCSDEEHRVNRRTEFKVISGPEIIYLK